MKDNRKYARVMFLFALRICSSEFPIHHLLKGAKVKIITVDKCFRYLGYRKKLIYVSKHCFERRNCSLSAIAPFANTLSTFVCN